MRPFKPCAFQNVGINRIDVLFRDCSYSASQMGSHGELFLQMYPSVREKVRVAAPDGGSLWISPYTATKGLGQGIGFALWGARHWFNEVGGRRGDEVSVFQLLQTAAAYRQSGAVEILERFQGHLLRMRLKVKVEESGLR